jgi:transcriptional regulator with XRE-family HTH domain
MTGETFGMVFAASLARRQMTDQEAAAELSTTQPTIQRWRTGRVVPAIDKAAVLATFCDMRPSDMEALLRSAERVRRVMPDTPDETLGALLHRLEYERGLSAADMIERTGIDRSRYYRLRADRTSPPLRDVPDLAARLQLDEERVVMAIYRSEIRGVTTTSSELASRT